MRCYTIQNLGFVNRCISLFDSGITVITEEIVENLDDFYFRHERVQPIYEYEDTFDRIIYDDLPIEETNLFD